MIKIESQYPPAIIRDLLGNFIVVPGWIKVPDGTTLDQLEWTDAPKVKHTIDKKVRYVESKRTGEVYTLVKIHGFKVTCTCLGYTYRSSCKHQKMWDTALTTKKEK